MKAIFKRELYAYFTTPIGYAYLVFYFVLSGCVFAYTTLFAMSADVSAYFSLMQLVLTVLLPLLTMKLLSEERRQKTEQVWLTAPVPVTHVVLGKFLAAYVLFGTSLVLSSLSFLILTRYAEVKIAVLFGNLLAMLLLGGVFLAVGLFVSALTEYQLAAAVGTVGILLGFLALSFVSQLVNVYWLRFILDGLSVYTRFRNFTQGVFDVMAMVYYLSLSGLFLFLTVRVYDRRRYL